MNSKNMSVLVNIIGAVESGGQIYGRRRYEAYAAPYTNTPEEHTITLGWAQNYGSSARELVRRIRDRDTTAFRKLDTAGIEGMLSRDWVAIRWNPTAAQKKALIAIITSEAGKAVQDEMAAEDLQIYITDCAKDWTKDIKAQMMYAEIRHLGGKGPVDRIFKRCSGNYSLDSIMASLKKDQEDTSCDNQVGDKIYWSRHEACYSFINKYAESEKGDDSNMPTAKDALDIMRSWLGMSRSAQTHRPIIDIYNSHKPLARGYAVTYWDDYCDATVSAVFIKLNAVNLIGGTECGVQEHVQIFRNKGIWKSGSSITPKPGWIIVYDWDYDGVADHIGFVESVSGSTITAIEGNTSGGIVGRRTINIGNACIVGYAAPGYSESGGSTYMFEVKQVKFGDQGPDVKFVQRLLRGWNIKDDEGKTIQADGSFGQRTKQAVLKAQKKFKLTQDGVAGPKTIGALTGL